jgi:murein DD-endopeptidase MepM/ murein hydrolase activator NlpD
MNEDAELPSRRSRRAAPAAETAAPDAPGSAAPLTRRAARAAGIAAPVVLTEAQEREAARQAELASFEANVRPRGRRAAASTEELAEAVAVAAASTGPEFTGPELTAAGVAEPVTPVAAIEITVQDPEPVTSDLPASFPETVTAPSLLTPADVLGELPATPAKRKPGRRAGTEASDDASTPPRVAAGRRAAAPPAEVAVDAPKSARDSSGRGAGEPAIPQQKRRQRHSTKNAAKRGFGLFAFVVAGGIAVATSLPAEAYFAATPDAPITQSVQAQAEQAGSGNAEKQQLSIAAEASTAPVDRDSYTVTVPAPKADMAGFKTSDTFSNDVGGTIQWPFPTGVPISDGFGYRSSPGGIGSTNHQGIDFNPGMGAPIQVVADGTVRLAQKSDAGGYGCYVIVDHNVNGLEFASLYGHMQCASVAMSKGDSVKVGDLVGKVGSTGTSTGAHLHFEIHDASDTPIDPMPWMTEHAN